MRTRPDTARSAGSTAFRLFLALACTWLAVVGAWFPSTADAATREDFGSAPASYDQGREGPARSAISGPLLGRTRNVAGDAIVQLGSYPAGVGTTIVREVGLSGVDRPARVCGWLDFDRDGAFAPGERSCADASTGSRTATLRWAGTPGPIGVSYLRLRVGFTAAQVERPSGPSDSGEVEDYSVRFVAVVPKITVTQEAEHAKITKAGQGLALRYLVTNTGSVTLNQVTVQTSHSTHLTCPGNHPVTLPPGGVLRCTAERAVTQPEVDSGRLRLRVGAVGEAPTIEPIAHGHPGLTTPGSLVSEGTVRDVSEVVVIVIGAKPAIQLTLKARPTTVSKLGDFVSYQFAATNTGNVSLSHLDIVDEIEGLGEISCDGPQTVVLLPGAVLTCTAQLTLTQADLDFGSLFNVASVFAEAPGGDLEDPSDDVGAVADTTTDVVQLPAVELVNATDSSVQAKEGEDATVRLVARNSGNVTLTRVRVTDSLHAVATKTCSPTGSVNLAPGASVQCTGLVRVSSAAARLGRLVDHAVVTAERPYGDPGSSADDVTDGATVRLAVQMTPAGADPLPATGGVEGRIPLFGLLALVLGSALILVGRRRSRRVPARPVDDPRKEAQDEAR